MKARPASISPASVPASLAISSYLSMSISVSKEVRTAAMVFPGSIMERLCSPSANRSEYIAISSSSKIMAMLISVASPLSEKKHITGNSVISS